MHICIHTLEQKLHLYKVCCDMSHSYVSHVNSNQNLQHHLQPVLCDMTHSYSLFCDMTHSCVPYVTVLCYGVATISRLLKIIGLFCRISSLL